MSRIRANTIVDSASTGAPTFPNGAIINGITTITADVATTGNNLTIGTGTTISNPSDNEFRILTNGSERVRVNSSGKVGIGTDDPDERLEVGDGTVSGALKVSGQSSSITSDGFTVDWESSTDSTRLFSEPQSSGSSQFKIYTTNSGTRSLAATINSSGNLAFPSGQGIDFSANNGTGTGTTTSSVLDDYEEGTWTPTGTADLSSVSNAFYIKVGRVVTITCRLNFASNSSSTRADIGGLPYEPQQNLSNSAMGSAVGETSYTATDRPVAAIENTGVIRFRIAGNTSMTYSNLSNVSVRMSLTYFSSS